MPFKTATSKRLGNIQSTDSKDNSFNAQTTFGKLKVSSYSPHVLRVTATQAEDFEDFSYSVTAAPQEGKLAFDESLQSIRITTSAIHLIIEKTPVRLSFQTPDGKIINEDDALGASWIGDQVTQYKKLQEGERFLGLGEKTGHLDRRGSGYQNWNTDAYAYHSGTDPLYSSIPFYLGVHHQLCYGIFLDNTHRTHFNFGASNNRFSSFAADAGELNYYFIYGNSIREIIQHYTWLTGRMELPPQWSIGYQQCRYSYYPDKEVLNVARTFREKDIPADAIVLDIHYMDKYKIFSWDKKNFSDPKGMIDALRKNGFHIVIMCDPGIKVEHGYETYEDGIRKDVFLKYPDGENYTGQVWPGWCHFPDFTNPDTRAWWADQFKSYVDLGVDGFWNDMNEIATWGHSLPENIEFDFEGNKATTRRGRNVFGFQMARSTYEGTKKLLNGKRPFNLTRSGFAGVQRYSALWTGDNVSYDEHMMLGVRIVNSLGLSGIAFAGYDAGGFVGDANTKLFARWMSIASLSPFFRAHTMINTRDSEPWSYGEEVEQICRNYIKFRYQLMPYIYSLFYDASQSGMPIQRSLAIDYTHQPQVYDGQYQHQYLFGPGILVAPVESHKDLTKIYLPAGEWFYLYTGKIYSGDQEIMLECPIHKLPIFVKAGSVLPMQKALMNTAEKTDELILHIYCGKQSSDFVFYKDDGETFRYQQGEFAKRKLEYRAENKVIIGKTEGLLQENFTSLKFIFHGLPAAAVIINGESRSLEQFNHTFFTPLEKYDPINDPDPMGEESVMSASVAYTSESIEVRW
ncbi:MAG TPA: glycoside hydrolase family 31 protein [Cyclobacteriaceae bacterium]|nr:glycoside hydrolase family 31 protein [Cyclobacteriaceae bacterium]